MIDKYLLHTHCQNLVLAKADELKLAIKNTREASNNDTKSSMGDKYETSREMLQQDLNRLQQQLAETNLMLFNLNALKIKINPLGIDVGVIAYTTVGLFYIAVSLGSVLFQHKQVRVISQASPLAKILKSKKIGDSFILNNKTQKILEVY